MTDDLELYGLRLVVEPRPRVSRPWLRELRAGLSSVGEVVSAYVVSERLDGAVRDALFVQVEAPPPSVEVVRELMAALRASGAIASGHRRAQAQTGSKSSGLSIHFFSRQDVAVISDVGVLVWERTS